MKRWTIVVEAPDSEAEIVRQAVADLAGLLDWSKGSNTLVQSECEDLSGEAP
jgi:hypothetical protein